MCVDALRRAGRLVLVAPPGAGKTTVVPGAVLDQVGPEGAVWVLEPRRLAARLAATRVAKERGGRLGDEVGYRVRDEDRSSARTRILFVTEGILTRRLVVDPFLEGIGAVVIDEFHERSIHADLGLAFLREAMETRPELKLVVMSATLDPGPVSAFLGDCPVVESQGRTHPLEVRWLDRPDERPVEDRVVAGVKRALLEPSGGDVLGFLPGAREIDRARRRLSEDLEGRAEVLGLHGQMRPELQDRAVAGRSQGGLPRVVLATNVAESSLTIPGVDTVVDGGAVKRARHDPGTGVDHLELGLISRFSAEQRAGRAARLGPGRVFRTWTEAEHRRLPMAEPPEIHRVDLASALLQILAFGSDPRRFGWFEAPAPGRIELALELLELLGATKQGRMTERGERLAQLPVHPRLGRLLDAAAGSGLSKRGARVAALASEMDIARDRRIGDRVGNSDLLERLERLEALERGARPEDVGLDGNGSKRVLREAQRLERLSSSRRSKPSGNEEAALRKAILAGFPDRVALRRDERLALADGGGARIGRDSVVKDAPLVVVTRIDGQRGGPVASALTAIEEGWLDGVRTESGARFDEVKERVEIVERVVFGKLELRSKRSRVPFDPSPVLAEAARQRIDRALPITDELQAFFNRYAFLRRTMPELELRPLDAEARTEVVEAVAMGKKSFEELRKTRLEPFLLALAPEAAGRLDAAAPERVDIPSGRKAKLRYDPEGPPVLSVRLQEVFGLHDTPRVAEGRVPVKMELLAPNQRPVQVTQDLANFWAQTYAEVRKELRRRYPKHQWPEDPADGIASTRVRPRRSK